jgi:hypothetical protein
VRIFQIFSVSLFLIGAGAACYVHFYRPWKFKQRCESVGGTYYRNSWDSDSCVHHTAEKHVGVLLDSNMAALPEYAHPEITVIVTDGVITGVNLAGAGVSPKAGFVRNPETK